MVGCTEAVLAGFSSTVVPLTTSAQEAVLSGTVVDSTGAVLPGVTITAVNTATGNTFVAVTDERGVYRVAARAGVYRLRAELQGFRAVTREGIAAARGQIVTVNLPMLEATAAETITVTREAPLVDVSTSSLGGNVDPTQVQELPVARTQLDGAGAARAGQPHVVDQRHARRCRTGTAARRASSSSTWTDSRCRRSSAPAISRDTARTRSPSSSSSRTGSTRRRADRPACR